MDADHGEVRYAEKRLLSDSGLSVASFLSDLSGELYVLDLFRGIYRLRPPASPSSTESTVPERLTETGCALVDTPAEPAEGLLGYIPAQQFWSDSAEKRRYLALPPGTQMTLLDSGVSSPCRLER